MSVHIEAKKGDIAPAVLMPGDPMRAKWIAETFLDNWVCYNRVRGMLGFTGTFNGKTVSVQGGGMGIPSTMIYCHELINEYGVKRIIRVGSAGAYQGNLELGSLVLAMAASTDSSFNAAHFQNASFAPTANFKLFMKAVRYAHEKKIDISAGNVLSSDTFYNGNPEAYKRWADFGVLCVEMETAAIYTMAAKFGIEALSILTISDSLVNGKRMGHKARESSFVQMTEMALTVV